MPRRITFTLTVPDCEWTWTNRGRPGRGTYTVQETAAWLTRLIEASSTASVRHGAPQEVIIEQAPAAPPTVSVDLAPLERRMDHLTMLIRCLNHPGIATLPNATDALAVLELDGSSTLVIDTESDDFPAMTQAEEADALGF